MNEGGVFKKDHKLSVAEYFYSIQGEGISMGYPSFFLRLAGCNLMCGGQGTQHDKLRHNGATWRCDTIETWMKGKSYGITQLIEVLNKQMFFDHLQAGSHLIITGGEPLLQQRSIVAFLEVLQDVFGIVPFVEVETNGTFLPSTEFITRVQQWNISPKLGNSGMHYQNRINKKALVALNSISTSVFKFVISNEYDWLEAKDIILTHELDWNKVWLMPAASNIEELKRNSEIVAQICLLNNVKFSSRLQVAIWNETVGV